MLLCGQVIFLLFKICMWNTHIRVLLKVVRVKDQWRLRNLENVKPFVSVILCRQWSWLLASVVFYVWICKSVLALGRLDDARAVYIKIKTIFRKVPALMRTLQRSCFSWQECDCLWKKRRHTSGGWINILVDFLKINNNSRLRFSLKVLFYKVKPKWNAPSETPLKSNNLIYRRTWKFMIKILFICIIILL